MFYKYELTPIDYFAGCQTLAAYINSLESPEDSNRVLTELALGMAEMRVNGSYWEGDISQGVFVFALPVINEFDMQIGFIWKQRNNGTTFVLSPCELTWLSECEIKKEDKRQWP